MRDTQFDIVKRGGKVGQVLNRIFMTILVSGEIIPFSCRSLLLSLSLCHALV